MALIVVKTGEKKAVKIEAVEDEDYRFLTKKRFSFLWKSLKTEKDVEVYKLRIEGEEDILGVVAIVDFPVEQRIEIKLLASSIENVGSRKIYDGIAGHLIAYACRHAVLRYGMKACVSLIPKTKLESHYIAMYGMKDAGWQLFLEGKSLYGMISKYLL